MILLVNPLQLVHDVYHECFSFNSFLLHWIPVCRPKTFSRMSGTVLNSVLNSQECAADNDS